MRAEEKYDPAEHNILRTALLSTQVMDDDEVGVGICLLMTALNVQPLGLTLPGREVVEFILLPNELKPAEVLQSWIQSYIDVSIIQSISSQDLIQLKALIVVISPIPRAIQYLVEVWRCSSKSPLEPEFLEDLYIALCKRLKQQYKEFIDCSLKLSHAKALLFQSQLPIDDDVLACISKSVFTNAIPHLQPNSKIVPFSTVMLFNFLKTEDGYVRCLQNSVSSLMDFIIKPPTIQSQGYPLED